MAINIDLGKIDFKSKEVQNVVGGIGIGIIAIFLFFTKVYAPIGIKIKEVDEKIVQKEKLYQDTKRKADKLPELEAEFADLKEELEDVEKKLPKEIGIPDLLSKTTKIGKKYSIDITNFSPKSKKKEKYYTIHPTAMTITTTYHRLGYFLAEMGQQERVLGFRNLKIFLGTGEKEKAVAGIVANFTLNAYTYNE